jgi:hypothetical protein
VTYFVVRSKENGVEKEEGGEREKGRREGR